MKFPMPYLELTGFLFFFKSTYWAEWVVYIYLFAYSLPSPAYLSLCSSSLRATLSYLEGLVQRKQSVKFIIMNENTYYQLLVTV